MRQIEDVKLYNGAFVAALEISGLSDAAQEAIFQNNGVAAINFFRAAGEQDGEAVFIFLARRQVLTLEDTAWPKLPEETKLFFDVFARVGFALVKPVETKERAVVREVVAGPRRVQDTIFEKGGRIDEKIGRGELSRGQPTSTAQVQIQRPGDMPDAEPFAAFGGKDPGQWSEAEKLAFAEKLGMKHHSQNAIETKAPEAGKFTPRVIKAEIGGDKVSGKVFVFDPHADGEDGA